ncbi:uncharacterized protein V1516DRAFT_673425 [Lipomyces oligophaga]|uniref:uncharacterized protein n=1 Tax=Lipomyces oligophaga TaxID=45792 RepID=UPI0034D01D97
MGKIISTSIVINAKPEKVREVFLDFKSHSEWDPFITRIEVYKPRESGVVKPGNQLLIDLTSPDGKVVTMYPIVLENSETLFSWHGKLTFDLIFGGSHSFEFQPRQNSDGSISTTLIQKEEFSGVLVPIFNSFLDSVEQRFIAVNEALKRRVEA